MSLSNKGYQIKPSTSALAEATAIFVATFGANVNVDPSSPTGLLIQNCAIAITNRQNDEADTIGSLNPNIASGIQLDAICANLDIERIPSINSIANIVVTGLPSTIIPKNSLVSSTVGDQFAVDADITIANDGIGNGIVTAISQGQIAVGINTITQIINNINGWDTVNNPTVGTIGISAQSDTSLRQTRVQQLAFSSSGSLSSIIAGASALSPNSFDIEENKSTTLIIIDGLAIEAKSIMLIIDISGTTITNEQIAQMLYKRLSGGCGMSGNNNHDIIIQNSSQVFTAKWQFPSIMPLGINIVLNSTTIYPPNMATKIADIININYDFDRIGKLMEATEFVDILINNGIKPIVKLTFNVGTILNLTQYTLPISDSIGNSMSSSNVIIAYE